MLKEELRKHYSALRRALTQEELEASSISITNQLLRLPIWSYDYYHVFLQIARNNEINTQHLLSVLQGHDKNIVIPKVMGENKMQHYLLTDHTRLVTNRWGIPEPKDGLEVPLIKIDLVFLPLLVFDLKGQRVGYGKGYYDQFLANCRKDTVKVGLSIFEPVELVEDPHKADIVMDYCVCPEKIFRF